MFLYKCSQKDPFTRLRKHGLDCNQGESGGPYVGASEGSASLDRHLAAASMRGRRGSYRSRSNRLINRI